MKVLVLFGSKSDSYVYEPLKAKLLNEGFEVDFRLLSVHRSPEVLDKELATVNADVVIAGAGLAAHLPGVVSSKVLLPVFGVPCTPALGGLDALLSIIQMPFGIPVLATAPDKMQDLLDFLKRWQSLDLRFSEEPFHLVVERNKQNVPYIKELVSRATRVAEKVKVELSILDRPKERSLNICLIEVQARDPEAPLPLPPLSSEDELRIYVPVFDPESYRNPQSGQVLLRRIQSAGGIWVGMNNLGNAMLAALLLANKDGAFSAFLTNAKKGYFHA